MRSQGRHSAVAPRDTPRTASKACTRQLQLRGMRAPCDLRLCRAFAAIGRTLFWLLLGVVVQRAEHEQGLMLPDNLTMCRDKTCPIRKCHFGHSATRSR
jgi:hypothetical protein